MFRWPEISYGRKLALLATVPLILSVTVISLIVLNQSRILAEREIGALEAELLDAKKAELRNYVTLARNGFFWTYGNRAPDDEAAKEKVKQILSAMIYGDEGFFFVFDYDGTVMVSPRQTDFIGQNLSGLTDSAGTSVTDELIRVARSGAGYHTFLWPKPSTGQEAQMVAYVVSLGSWNWALGTGVFIDDVLETVATARADVETRIAQTFYQIAGITTVALLLVFLTGVLITVRERRLADAKLKALTQRVIDTQEEERSRVARELHDSISQILVGVRYALDTARRRLARGDAKAGDSLDRGLESLTGAIHEVRRISRDLRPGVLDDLGLGPALKTLIDDFATRTGIEAEFNTVVFRNRLDGEAKTALYRVAQEALTNIERHAQASRVSISLKGSRTGALMRIADNGVGLPQKRNKTGLGLRNMSERIEQLDGTLRVLGSSDGTVVEASVPLTHILPPSSASKNKRKGAA